MVAVAAPGTEGSVKAANLFDAIGDGVTTAGNEIAGDHGEVGAEIISHIHGAANLRAGHIAAEVDVADLDDLQAIESGRQIVDGNFDAADLVVEALGGETIHGTEKWGGAGSSSGGAEEVAAARISNSLGQFGRGWRGVLLWGGFFRRCGAQQTPEAFQPVDRFDG